MSAGYLHAAYESVVGTELNTPTLSTKVIYLPALSFAPALNPAPLERDDELRGLDEPMAVIPEMYDPTWGLETRMYPDLTGFLLKLILGAPTTTAGDGIITDPDAATIPVGAFRHVWTAPYGPTGLSPLTAQFQAAYKDETVFFRLKGSAADTFAITNPASGGSRIASSGPALYMARIADPALTATYESLAIVPFLRRHITIGTWLTGTGITEDFSVTISNPLADRVRTMGAASAFADDLEKGDTPITVTGSIPKRAIDLDDYDALLNATGFATKIRWQSTVNVTGSYKYAFWLEMPNCQYTDGGPEALTNARRHGASFDFKATNASGAAGSSKWTLVNATTSYA